MRLRRWETFQVGGADASSLGGKGAAEGEEESLSSRLNAALKTNQIYYEASQASTPSETPLALRMGAGGGGSTRRSGRSESAGPSSPPPPSIASSDTSQVCDAHCGSSHCQHVLLREDEGGSRHTCKRCRNREVQKYVEIAQRSYRRRGVRRAHL